MKLNIFTYALLHRVINQRAIETNPYILDDTTGSLYKFRASVSNLQAPNDTPEQKQFAQQLLSLLEASLNGVSSGDVSASRVMAGVLTEKMGEGEASDSDDEKENIPDNPDRDSFHYLKLLTLKISLVFCDNTDQTILDVEGSLLDELRKLCVSNKRVTVKVTMSDFLRDIKSPLVRNEEKVDLSPFIRSSSCEMQIKKHGKFRAYCSDRTFYLPYMAKRQWSVSSGNEITKSIQCWFTIELNLCNFFEPNLSITPICQDILKDSIASDVVIYTSDDKSVPCHKNFLSANSHILKTMLTIDMRESQTGKIEMMDMTEKGVQAFLSFLYYREIGDAKEDPSIALELMNAAEKYDIKDLKIAMERFLASKEESWWPIDVTLKVYGFMKDSTGTEFGVALKKKILHLLKKKLPLWLESKVYQSFAKDNPNFVLNIMEDVLLTYYMSTK